MGDTEQMQCVRSRDGAMVYVSCGRGGEREGGGTGPDREPGARSEIAQKVTRIHVGEVAVVMKTRDGWKRHRGGRIHGIWQQMSYGSDGDSQADAKNLV